MTDKGRCRYKLPRQASRPGAWASFGGVSSGLSYTAREGPEGDGPLLDRKSSALSILGKGFAIGAALGGAGLVPGITVSGADITGGMDVAMELSLESEETTVVSIDVENKEELKSEQEPASLEEKEETLQDVLIEDEKASPAKTASSKALSESEMISQESSQAESAFTSMDLSEAPSESEASSGSSASLKAAAESDKKAVEEGTSAAESEEEQYEEYYEDEDFWETPSEILDDLIEDFLETNEEKMEETTEQVDKQEEAQRLKASEQTSLAASEKQSMFTSIAVAASELQEAALKNAVRLESQYGLRDFAALANAMAHENDSVRKSLDATISQSEGDSEQMASILDTRSEREDALSSESASVMKGFAAMRERAVAFSTSLQESGRGESPSELM